MLPNTKKLRVQYNNLWPESVVFPLEERFKEHLASQNLSCPFHPAPLEDSEDDEFHRILASILDALDALPLRPDKAFEALWTALDAEMFKVREQNGDHNRSRFVQFLDKIYSHSGQDRSWALMTAFLELVPLQTCEYAAVRILEAINTPGKHSEYFLAKVKPAVGVVFVDEFNGKYGSAWAVGTPPDADERARTQRKAGAFLQLALKGEEVTISNVAHHLNDMQRLSLFACAVLPNIRNEKFHGATFPSYRSSATKLKHYASGYFVFSLAYFMMLHAMLYKDFRTISTSEVEKCIEMNTELFRVAFAKFLRD
jgi:hypothetical protein